MINFIRNLIKRAKVTLNYSDNQSQYTGSQVIYMGNPVNMEIINPYGISAVAPIGSQVLMFNIQGQEENRIGFVFNPPDRFMNLQPGEVQIGNTVKQTYIKFDKDGSITIESTQDITINAQETTVNGHVNLGGSGGAGVARIGDSVVDGVITTGSTIVKAN